MRITESDKKFYLYECKNFEEYLVNKELGTLNKNKKNKNNINKTKGNKNLENFDEIVDNHKEVYERQNIYKKSKMVSNKIIQQILCLIINEKETIHKDIYNYLYNFVVQLNEYSQLQNNNCIEQKNKLNLPILKLNYDREQKTFQSLLNLDYYYFKCLRNVNESYENSNILVQSQNNNTYLNEDQLINIFGEVRKNKILLSDFDEEKLKIVQKRYNIISIVKLIITDSKKYDVKLKNEFINLLKTDKDNVNTFIQYLNTNRAKLQYHFSKNTFNEMAELFTIIIEGLVKKNDLLILRQIFLMSNTYYIEENGTKLFLSKKIKKLSFLNDSVFWANYLAASVLDELKKSEKKNQSKKYELNRRSLAIFSSVLTTIQSMIEYDVDLKFINNFLEKHVYKVYSLTDESKEELRIFLDGKFNSNKKNTKNNTVNEDKKQKQKCEDLEDVEKNINIENEIENQINNEDEKNNNVINSDN